MRWSLKQLTAVVAMAYGLVTLVTAGWAFYLERNWYQDRWQDTATIEQQVTQIIGESGVTPALPQLLQRMNSSMGWSASYITEVGGADPRILTSTASRFENQTWTEADQAYRLSDFYWRGNLDRTFEGPDGKQYAIWALLDRRSIAWPLLNQIALVTAAAAWLGIATWLTLDVRDRGVSPVVAWFLLGVLTGPVGAAVWLVSRPVRGQARAPVCPGCGHTAPAGAGFCPRCGFALQPICPECRHPVDLDWAFCTSCGTSLADEPAEVEGSGALL